MTLAETIDNDLKLAMKAKELEKLSTLRLVKAALTNFMIEKKKTNLADSEVLEILQKQVKQRRESYESYVKAGRQDLSAKEQREIEILQRYLPKVLTDAELKTLVEEVIATCQAKSQADLGKVMKELMPLVKGRAAGKRVNEIVLRLLG